jgi:DNA-binding IclR family transcriptional regulator
MMNFTMTNSGRTGIVPLATSDVPHMVKRQRGIQSVEIGLQLALVLADSGRPLQLKEIASRANLSASKVHRYLVSLGRAGLVQQLDGRYELGRAALDFGLAALGRIDVVRLASPALSQLRDQIGETVFLAIWGNLGATIVRWEESNEPVTLNVRIGSVMPLVTSATGRAFAAFMPWERVRETIAKELALLRKRNSDLYMDLPAFKSLLKKIRAESVSQADGTQLSSISAVSAPVFDSEARMVAAITALGPRGLFDCSVRGPMAKALLAVSRDVSASLGYRLANQRLEARAQRGTLARGNS